MATPCIIPPWISMKPPLQIDGALTLNVQNNGKLCFYRIQDSCLNERLFQKISQSNSNVAFLYPQ